MIEFLHILDEYRVKCEDEGNYLEAGRAAKQLETLKKQEAKRQEKALRARQLAERQDVQIAHNMQYAEFNAAWDKYLEEYDQMAHMYIQQMTERHAVTLREFQEDLHRQVRCRFVVFALLCVFLLQVAVALGRRVCGGVERPGVGGWIFGTSTPGADTT